MKKLLLLQEVHDQRILKTEWLQLAPPPKKYREMMEKVAADLKAKVEHKGKPEQKAKEGNLNDTLNPNATMTDSIAQQSNLNESIQQA